MDFTPLFDPEALHQIVKDNLDQPLEDAFDGITRDLAERYPGHIFTGERDWIFNNAGGAMGQITLLHASLTEYLLLFGTPIGTEGHSGRYRTEVHDFMIAGEMWTYIEGETHRTVHRPGDWAYLGSNKVKGYVAREAAWMLEYSRGPIPSMLPFGLADTLFSTLDMRNFARTLGVYGKLVVKELAAGRYRSRR